MSEGGAIGAMFAATHPDRVSSLILLGTATKCWIDPDVEPLVDDYIDQHWGTGGSLNMGAPSVADDQRIRAWSARIE